MDLKCYKEKILLHMINHATRLSITVILPSKKPDQIVNAIMKYWVSIYWIVQRQKLVLSEMLNKVLEENHCSWDIALA